ncbi:MAG: hypothetical protein U1A26_02780 [Candidatus Sungbacteria bacterium]|nr:hypothetical protein [Candidatus Sungbacteria bacterium]
MVSLSIATILSKNKKAVQMSDGLDLLCQAWYLLGYDLCPCRLAVQHVVGLRCTFGL